MTQEKTNLTKEEMQLVQELIDTVHIDLMPNFISLKEKEEKSGIDAEEKQMLAEYAQLLKKSHHYLEEIRTFISSNQIDFDFAAAYFTQQGAKGKNKKQVSAAFDELQKCYQTFLASTQGVALN